MRLAALLRVYGARGFQRSPETRVYCCNGMAARVYEQFIDRGSSRLIIADLAEIAGRTYPARRRTQNLVGGASPIQATNFSMGCVTLEPHGGQVPWHNQEQEEIYLILEGEGEMCLGSERTAVKPGQAVYIPPGVYHQLTNTSANKMRMIYCYGPAGAVAHWRQELEGTLPRAGVEAPALPAGSQPQHLGIGRTVDQDMR
jgi:mannose-6-phosphate isomerase-like protein (cupin superfamily)